MLDTSATEILTVPFQNGNSAQALWLASHHTSRQALETMELLQPSPALVIIGGASLMTPESLDQLQTVFNQVLAPMAQALNLTVLDGGTDAGVIHMMGQARHHIGGDFSLIGVVPQGKVRLPHDSGPAAGDDRHDLEPHHTHFFLIPGDDWGSESPWLADFASQVAANQPSLTLLINGGKVALTDLQANLATGRPALVLAGSGRLADTIALALGDVHSPDDSSIRELIATYQPSGQLAVLDLSLPTDQMRDRLQPYFAPVS
jgi:hypothetical protein